MARKQGYQGDFSKLDTRAGARNTSQEKIDAARTRAAGKEQPRKANPELQAYAKNEVEDRVRRTVMGHWENKGRSPSYILTPHQFGQFQQTGGWEGMPTEEEYGPHSYVPDDIEWHYNEE